ncbi:MAG TPA: tRNA guanosine(34) transglycosylase Tgt [Rectinemataceae bacterium]|nr:tRNA guanosine(34) transglycosylase Tgt [Rectinemataceae bacterium]
MNTYIFERKTRDPATRARTGRIRLPHGHVETPAFMPVGTNATVKAVEAPSLAEIGFDIILANTYHLMLRPGPEVIREAGGLHGFSGWKGNFLTDSGGFQVFSLSALRKITEDGVAFRSHIDGSKRFLSPESAVEIQTAFNSDIQMQLDVCSAWGAERAETERALALTSAWAGRAKARWERARDEEGYAGSLFAIVQGGFYKDLRMRSAGELALLDFPGYAIGGLSVGEPFETYAELLAHTAPLLPEEKPKYIMGIGTPEYILEAIAQGIDIFDCVFPTRTGRNGLWFTSHGPLSIKKARYERDFAQPDPDCGCRVCRNHSRAYIRHLFKCDEILHSMLASYHNLFFLHDLVKRAAQAIEEGRFSRFKDDFLAAYNQGVEVDPKAEGVAS